MFFSTNEIVGLQLDKPMKTEDRTFFLETPMRDTKKTYPIFVWSLAFLFFTVFFVGCSQTHSTVKHQVLSLEYTDLEAKGLAFITPSTVTGQEEEMQAVAFTFAEVLKRKRPDIECITLPETLSAVNTNGLAEEYKRMYEDYRNTGLFKKDILKQIGEVTNTLYLAQIKLSGFQQHSKGRFSFLGLRLLQTQNATIRLFFQIWNSEDGTIAWEGVEELSYAVETFAEDPVTLRYIIEIAAEDLIDKLPEESKNVRKAGSE